MLEKGLSARSAATVAAGNTAAAMGSGDLAVFATPAMVALMENAAMTAVAGELPEGATTVGSEMNVTHIKPSGLGAEITATAVLAEVEGRKLTFNVGARDAEGLIGEGIRRPGKIHGQGKVTEKLRIFCVCEKTYSLICSYLCRIEGLGSVFGQGSILFVCVQFCSSRPMPVNFCAYTT